MNVLAAAVKATAAAREPEGRIQGSPALLVLLIHASAAGCQELDHRIQTLLGSAVQRVMPSQRRL